MFFQFFAPQRQKCAATAVQSVCFGKISLFAPQIAPFDVVACNACVCCHDVWLSCEYAGERRRAPAE